MTTPRVSPASPPATTRRDGDSRRNIRRDVFEIEHVPHRENIEIHHGNTTKDTKGCILVGIRFGTLDDDQAVLRSDLAFANLMGALVGIESFDIDVTDTEGKQEVLT